MLMGVGSAFLWCGEDVELRRSRLTSIEAKSNSRIFEMEISGGFDGDLWSLLLVLFAGGATGLDSR